ncbi:acyltransferase family protein, partial [Escherichia coli]|nr:acyltransferase family protein [Escherichia coli]
MIKSIQILRALAAWAVVYHHISQVMFQWSVSSKLMHTIALKAGNGVDIFFVISGFIIYKSISKNNITPTSFALNRMVRIIPAYWFYTLLVVIISYNFHGVIPFAEIGLNNVLKSLAFIPVMNQQIGWYIPTLTVGWTLNFEMLFYTCVFISLLFPGNNKRFCCVLIPLVVMNLFSWLGNNESTVFLFYNDELLFEFVMGVVIAICYNNGLFRNIGVKTAITISVLSLISIFFSNESKRLLQIGIPCAALIVSA